MNKEMKIAIIGSTQPGYPYESSYGFNVGYLLTTTLPEAKVFTGGVNGVGLDVFLGCVAASKTPNYTVMIPNGVLRRNDSWDKMLDTEDEKFILEPYDLPESYTTVSKITKTPINIVRAGEHMGERRRALVEACDTFIVMHGSNGTLDEALGAIESGKRVVVIENTGGAAFLLAQKKNNTMWKIGGKKSPYYAMSVFVDHLKDEDMKNLFVAATEEDAVELIQNVPA